MNSTDFWMSFLASLLANAVIYIPILLAILVLLRRYYPVLRIWDIPLLSKSGKRYMLVMSSRPDSTGHFRAGASEQEAMVDVRDFFQTAWLRLSCRITMLKPLLSERVSPNSLGDVDLILFGGPLFNKWTGHYLKRLEGHDLQYIFKETEAGWTIWDSVHAKAYDSDYVCGNPQSERNHYDHGLFIRAPNIRGGSVIIFAGNHGAGTIAAVEAVLKPHLCQKIFAMMKERRIKADYFLVLVKVSVQEFIRDEPIILDIKPIAASC